MTIRITKQGTTGGLIKAVERRADVNLSVCYQCRKCSIGCPVAGETQSPPSEIIRRLQLGAGDELLQTDLIWTCLACETCYARCPNQITSPPSSTPRVHSRGERVAKPKGDAPLFNRSFLNSVKSAMAARTT